ncbi:hypothetical protein ABI59_07505 [Acidobacteria bacterium Mor1]|nr:hypothetical protein ABI59_07505 [Acidobacteria bacterium Mor1]
MNLGSTDCCSRRGFLKSSVSCAGYLLALASLGPATFRSAFASSERERMFVQDWGWIEKLAEGVWSHISTPFEQSDYTTVCNGGIIAGSRRVLAVESFQRPRGAAWLAECAKKLTGRWPTDFVVTHFHGDHVSGSSGYLESGQKPTMWLTKTTRDLIAEGEDRREVKSLTSEVSLLADEVTDLDLGGRVVKLSATRGHTDSDVAIEVVDPNVVFAGDLVWNRLVPNYRDADPVALKQAVASLARESDTIYVPGHGVTASLKEFRLYQEFLDTMEDAARRAHGRGDSWEAAAKAYRLSGKFEDWFVFADSVMPAIFRAWYSALDGDTQPGG